MSRRLSFVFSVVFVWLLADARFVAADDISKRSKDEPQLLVGQPRTDYQARRQELMKRIKEAESRSAPTPRRRGPRQPVIVLRGSDDPDIEGKFRQSNDFAYLTGTDLPSAYLILLPNEGKETLYLPPSPFGRGLNASRPGPGEKTAELLGIQKVESTEKLLGDLFGAIGDALVPRRGSSAVVYLHNGTNRGSSTSAEDRLVQLLRDGCPNTEFKDVSPTLAEMRKAKSKTEIDLLRKAIAITGDAQAEVLRTIRPGIPEYVLEGKILGAFTGGGALRAGFPSIVGSGPNSTIPHYFENSRILEDGDLVVVDIGAEYKYYTADITRTYPANGKFTSRQREIYQLVLDAQKAVQDEMKPGETRLMAMTQFTKDYLRKSPLRAKDEDGNEHTMDYFFIHGLGHYLGMDVHDVGSYAEPVKVGEVFTIEPGIYIKSENLGVRIEDDYLMTEFGPEKISKDIPSDPDEIERRIAEGRKNINGSASAAKVP
jgi:Xaa-Pro aminopeptidase